VSKKVAVDLRAAVPKAPSVDRRPEVDGYLLKEEL